MNKEVGLAAIGCAVTCLVGAFVSAQEPVHWDVFEQILDEAFERSEVMENAGWLTDVYGPRNSKSSGYVEASKWARQKLENYGLSTRPCERPYTDMAVFSSTVHNSVLIQLTVLSPVSS